MIVKKAARLVKVDCSPAMEEEELEMFLETCEEYGFRCIRDFVADIIKNACVTNNNHSTVERPSGS